MEPISRVIVSLVYYNSLIRDTLEYTLDREEYNADFYDYKRNGIINELKVQSPLKVFIDQNGEKGQDFKKQLEELIELLYGENSTIIRKIDGKIEVDHNLNVELFEKVIPMHESINNIVLLHKEFAIKNNNLEPKVEKLLEADERFYRAVAFMTITQELRRQFVEYNKAMVDANKGNTTGVPQKSPQANFIEQDLNKLAQLIGLVRANAKCTDEIYTGALDKIFNYIEMMNGKRDLPKGKSFEDAYNEVGIFLAAFVEDAEKNWKENYGPILNELIEENKKLQANAQDAKA